MKRTLGWQGRLSRYLAEAKRLPYQPGSHDCVLFAAGAVEALTGVDLAADFRGQYDTVESGLNLVHRAGYLDYVDIVRSYFPGDRADRARIGDLAAVHIGESMPTLGVVLGSRVCLLSEKGLGVIGLLDETSVRCRFVPEIFKVG